MAEHPIQGLMGVTIEKIRDMVDTSTIIGDPIHVDDTTTIIPVSRVTFGFASGGSDVAPQSSKQMFGGGSGAGVTVSPVCFLVIGKDGSANILGINAQASDTVDRLVEMIPGAINKVSNFVSGFKGKTEDAAEVAEPLSGDE